MATDSHVCGTKAVAKKKLDTKYIFLHARSRLESRSRGGKITSLNVKM